MRHLKSGRKFNRTASHRKAMLANLATSILDKERVKTTLTKAKEVRGVVERQITYGKKGDLGSIRLAAKTVKDKDVLKKLFDEIAPGYKDRQGGYTRIIKIGDRAGDNAPMAYIELVGRDDEDIKRKRNKKKKASKAVSKKKETKVDSIEKKPEPKEESVETPESALADETQTVSKDEVKSETDKAAEDAAAETTVEEKASEENKSEEIAEEKSSDENKKSEE